jgi:hypothetical protein
MYLDSTGYEEEEEEERQDTGKIGLAPVTSRSARNGNGMSPDVAAQKNLTRICRSYRGPEQRVKREKKIARCTGRR